MNIYLCTTFLFSFLWCLAASAQSPGNFKLGALLPLTGPVAQYGAASKNGIELARQDFPELCRGVEIFYEDSKYEGPLSVSGFRALVEQKQVDAMYLWGTGPTHAVPPLAERKRVVTFAVTIERIPSISWNWVVRADNYAEQFIEPLAKYLRNNNVHSLAMVKTNLSYFESLSLALAQTLQDGSGKMESVESVNPEERDFRTVVARLKAKNVDALGVYLLSDQLDIFFAQAKQHGLRLPLFGTDEFASIKGGHEYGELIDDAVFPSTAVNASFVERYTAKYGEGGQVSYAAKAYDFLHLLCTAINHDSFKAHPSELLQQFVVGTSLDGATGHVTIVKGRDGERSFDYPVVLRRVGGTL